MEASNGLSQKKKTKLLNIPETFMPSNFIAQCFLMGHPMKSVFSMRAVSNANTEIHHAVPCFFVLFFGSSFPASHDR